MAPSGVAEQYACYCLSCTEDGRSGPNLMCRKTFYNHRQREKCRRLEYGGQGGGTASATLPKDGRERPSAEDGLSATSGRQGRQTPGGDGAGAQAAVEADRRRCDADETPGAKVASSDSTSNDGSDGSDGSNDVPPPDFITDPEPEDQIGLPPIPIYQPTVSTNEVRLPVGQCKDCRAHLSLQAITVQHDLTQASIADLLQLCSCAATYSTPQLMERFGDASVSLETRLVDCCIKGFVALTHTRAQQTSCDACGSPRFKDNGKPAKQVTFCSLTSWLAHLLSDPIIGKSMTENMAAARKAADEVADGVHKYPHSSNFCHFRDAGLLDHGTSVPVSFGTYGSQFFRHNRFEGWPVTATLLSLCADQWMRTKYQLLLVVTPGPRQPVDLELVFNPSRRS